MISSLFIYNLNPLPSSAFLTFFRSPSTFFHPFLQLVPPYWPLIDPPSTFFHPFLQLIPPFLTFNRSPLHLLLSLPPVSSPFLTFYRVPLTFFHPFLQLVPPSWPFIFPSPFLHIPSLLNIFPSIYTPPPFIPSWCKPSFYLHPPPSPSTCFPWCKDVPRFSLPGASINNNSKVKFLEVGKVLINTTNCITWQRGGGAWVLCLVTY